MGAFRAIRRGRPGLVIAACAVMLAAGGVSIGSIPAVASSPPTAPLALCGNPGPAPSSPRHVIVLMLENLSYNSVVGSPNTPYQTSLAHQCGNATSFFSATHSSAANYLAVSSGEYPPSSPPGCGTAKSCADSSDNIYSQLTSTGQSWGNYMESMPGPCYPKGAIPFTSAHTLYVVGHNPAVFYTKIPPAECQAHDIGVDDLAAQSGPFWNDLQNQTLPAFSFVTPNAADDNEGNGTKTQNVIDSDNFVQKFVSTVQQSNSYQAGNTLLLITYDEGAGGDRTIAEDCTNVALDLPITGGVSAHQDSCHIPTFVVYPYTPTGASDATFFDHYSITKTVEQLFGLPYLGHAGDPQTASLVGHFGITAGVAAHTPPAVAIGAPASGAAVTGPLTVSGTAVAGSSPISHVDVGVDAAATVSATGTTAWSAGIDTSTLSNGSHTIHVTATDSAGITGSASVDITVDNPPPDAPPVAAATGGCSELDCSFDSAGSSDSDGSVASYLWDFGDGQTDTTAAPTHHYSSPGTYNYSLTVTDDQGVASAPVTGQVTATAPPGPTIAIEAPLDASTVSGDLTVSGTTTAGAADVAEVDVSVDDGAPTVAAGTSDWSADIDSTGLTDGPHVIHVHAVDTAGDGASAAVDVTVANAAPPPPDQPPVAAATVNCAGLTCSFDGTGSTDPDGSVASYSWDFGDGTTSTTSAPTHTYTASGNYPYSLTVTDDQGVSSTTFGGTASPTDSPPVAAASASCTSLRCSFDGSASSDSDGSIASYAWDLGDGTTSTAVSPHHTYGADGTYPYSLTVTDDMGVTGTYTGTVSVHNAAPVAAANATCSGLSCTFDGSTSSDSDGSVASYAWDFGDGSSGSTASPSHTYAAGGTYNYSLTVTDDVGATSTAATGSVTVTQPVVPIGFRAASHTFVKSATVASGAVVTAPASVRAGDTELLFASTPVVGSIGTPAGWTLVAQQTSAPLQVMVFKHSAIAADAGATVKLPVLASTEAGLQVMDYSGVGPAVTAIGAQDSSTTTHVTPQATVTAAGSWAVSYWADKSSTTTAWTLPAGVTGRDTVIGTSGGHPSAALADSGGPVPLGRTPSQTATVTGGASGKGATMTVVMPPLAAAPDVPPVASANATCQGLSCTFDGSASTDSDGTVASYSWTFGDGAGGNGKTATHTYSSPGTYPYFLTVTDDQGVSSLAFAGSVTVTVAPPATQVGFRAASDAYLKTATVATGASVVAPSAVRAGDTELLFVAGTAVGAIGTPPGWTVVAQQAAAPLEAKAFSHVAGSSDAGAKVTVPVLVATGMTLQLADYSGAGPIATAVAAMDSSTATHLTPKATVTTPGSWVVSYWSDKSSTTTSWTLPAGVVSRDADIGIGGGHPSAVIADSGQPVSPGTTQNLTATVTGGASAKAAMFTVVVPPHS